MTNRTTELQKLIYQYEEKHREKPRAAEVGSAFFRELSAELWALQRVPLGYEGQDELKFLGVEVLENKRLKDGVYFLVGQYSDDKTSEVE